MYTKTQIRKMLLPSIRNGAKQTPVYRALIRLGGYNYTPQPRPDAQITIDEPMVEFLVKGTARVVDNDAWFAVPAE